MSKTIKGIAVMMMLGLTAVMAGASPLDGVEINHLGTNNTIVRVNGERKYLLLPVPTRG